MRLKQIGSAGNKTRRYHERPNETSNTEVKETMKVAITAKRVVILMMTMALAVALVACSAAAGKPGPAGPKGDKGEPGETTTPTDPTTPPTTPVEPGPVRNIKGIDPFIFNDNNIGAMDTTPRTIDVSDRFYPSTGLMYSIEGYSKAEMDRIDASVTEDGMLTVMLKSGAKYMNDPLEVKATDGTSSDKAMFHVRRNRAPMDKSTGTRDSSVIGEPVPMMIWVTEDEMSVPAHNVNATGDAPATHIPIVIGNLKTTGTIGDGGPDSANFAQRPYFFHDDAGNKLSLVSDVSVGDAKRLMVVDGEMKVTLTGMKSTYNGAATSNDHTPVKLMVSAIDDGGLVSDNEEHVLTIHIDMAPMTKGRIGTKVITLGTTSMDKVAVPGAGMYFEDDRETEFDFFVWSDKPEIASVSVNSQNKDDVPVMFDATTAGPAEAGFYVEGKSRGIAMIMVKAKEKAEATTDFAADLSDDTGGSAGKNQSVTLTFMVEVN